MRCFEFIQQVEVQVNKIISNLNESYNNGYNFCHFRVRLEYLKIKSKVNRIVMENIQERKELTFFDLTGFEKVEIKRELRDENDYILEPV